MPEENPPWQTRNKKGQLLDLYGRTTVYEGSASNRDKRYIVWYGWRSSGSFTGERTTYDTLRQALRSARAWERLGYDTKITDRLVPEGKP